MTMLGKTGCLSVQDRWLNTNYLLNKRNKYLFEKD